MRKSTLLPVLLLGAALAGCSGEAPTALSPSGASLSVAAEARPYVMISGSGFGASFRAAVAARGDVLESIHEKGGFAVVRTAAPDAYTSFASTIVEDAQIQWLDKDDAYREAVTARQARAVTASAGEDDPMFALQWGHRAVRSAEAWRAGQRGRGARVFVLDDGIDSDHPDLAPNLNTALSRSFVPGEPFEYVENFRNDPFSHGTHVSGIIAAADNGIGTIGVAPEAELVMLKVLSSLTGSGRFSWIVAAQYYAADNGADVINMSLGADVPMRLLNGFISVLNHAANYAHQKGAIVIVSAGNDATDADHTADLVAIPAAASNTLAISATGPLGWGLDQSTNLDHLAFYSNYGQSFIDFAAPGGNVDFSLRQGPSRTWPTCTVAGTTRACWVFDLAFSTGSAGSYYWSAGTSMAAPHAAGIAALIIGENGGSMHPAQVESAMAARAADLGKPGKDDAYGNGRVSSGH